METIEGELGIGGRLGRMLIPSRVIAAIGQLTQSEQDAVHATLETIQRDGLKASSGLRIDKTDADDHLYYVHTANLPDVRIILRVVGEGTINVVDIVRAETLHNIFHAS